MTPAFAWVLTAGLLALGAALSLNSFRLHRLGKENASDWCQMGAWAALLVGVVLMQVYLNSAEPWEP